MTTSIYIKDYKLIRADHGNVKRGAVCVYFKGSLPTRFLPNPYLKECLIFKVSTYNKRDYIVPTYQSPSQTFNDFNSFTTNMEKIVVNKSSSNPHFIIMIVDFDTKSNNSSSNDTTTAEDDQLDY